MLFIIVAIQPNRDATLIQGAFSALYLGTAAIIFLADRSRLGLLAGAIAPRARARRSVGEVSTGTVSGREAMPEPSGAVVSAMSTTEIGEQLSS